MNGDVGTFVRVTSAQTFGDFLRDFGGVPGVTPEALMREFDSMQKLLCYRSDHYTVWVDDKTPHGFGPGLTIWHLSIKRNDREPIMDWRDLQAIKAAICGAECEALQLFPAESRVVDTANQYHLFAFMKIDGRPLPLIPVGWTTGQKSNRQPGKTRQRPITGVDQ